ncbi:MAG: ExbD/TolR family protein [Leptothrix ochracea]|uniref:ExbD/TolR family protein n=1 Tax=Leptothrix ochracea TaxID=735331 RepID=UPI0034E253DB
MNFRHRRSEEPEINLIPFIDVLLVVLIFLMLSTTYTRFNELKVTLPMADTQKVKQTPHEITVSIASDGRFSVNGRLTEGASVEVMTAALIAAAEGQLESPVVISADALATHQSVVTVMDAARRAELLHLTFATQGSRTGASAR